MTNPVNHKGEVIGISNGLNYFEAHPDYLARKKYLEDAVNETALRFPKRLKKARLKDRARDLIWKLKAVEKEMVSRNVDVEFVDSVRNAIHLLKILSK